MELIIGRQLNDSGSFNLVSGGALDQPRRLLLTAKTAHTVFSLFKEYESLDIGKTVEWLKANPSKAILRDWVYSLGL